MNCPGRYQKRFFFIITISLQIGRKQISFFIPIFRNIFFLIVTVTITERFNIYFSKIMWLLAMWSFLLSCVPNFISVPLLYHWNWVKRFPTATLFHNSQSIFQTFDNKGAMEMDFSMIQFEKHSFHFSVRNWNCK